MSSPALKPSKSCPCSSGKPYRDCCRPLHQKARSADSAVELMRSRYSAFALGEIEYLVETLHPQHADLKSSPDELRASLRSTCRGFRFTGLTVEEALDEGADRAHVTFLARLFEKGADRSFRERSAFERTADGWRYLSGEALSR